MTELKPCPFCGGNIEIISTYSDDLLNQYWYFFCTNCLIESTLYDTEKEAINACNRRAE